MGERLDEITARAESVGQLDSIITAMRGIAASRLRQCQSRAGAIRHYAQDIAIALGQILLFAEPQRTERIVARRAIVLFGSEQGFVGNLNDRLLETIQHDLVDSRLLLVGRRLRDQAGLHRIEPIWSYPMASHPDMVGTVASAIADRLYADVQRGLVTTVDIVCPSPASNGTVSIARHTVLPFDFERFRAVAVPRLPTINLPARELLDKLALEYVFAQLSEAASESLAGENLARMMTLAAAKDNIAAMLEDLTLRQAGLRQEKVTEELVELAAGSGAAPRFGRRSRY